MAELKISNDLQNVIKNVIGDVGGDGDTFPIGAMLPYGNTTPPENWLICDGSEVSRTTYAELFNVIGTSYGSGDGSTTFNLPDKRGRGSVGLDENDNDFNVIGKKIGEKTHTLTLQEMPSHNHGIIRPRWSTDVGANAFYGSNGTGLGSQYDGNGYQGGSQPHNNIQPSEVDCWIIKASKTTSTPITSEVTNTYSESENNVYSCNYINEKIGTRLNIKQVSGLSLGQGATLQDDVIKKANQVTIYYTMNNNGYRHSETIQKNDTEWHFDVLDVYAMYIKVDWGTGTLATSVYDSNSKIIGYDLLYTDN